MIYVSVRVRGCRRRREWERRRAADANKRAPQKQGGRVSRAQKGGGRSGATTNDPSPAQSCSAAICRWDDAKLRITSAKLQRWTMPCCTGLGERFLHRLNKIRVLAPSIEAIDGRMNGGMEGEHDAIWRAIYHASYGYHSVPIIGRTLPPCRHRVPR